MKILIVCPTYVPSNSPDNQRIRISIPYFKKAGHQVTVLAVDSTYVEAPIDQVLEKMPDITQIIRTKAFKAKYTRMLGLGNLGYRSLYYLFKEGSRFIKKERPDIIYFSTTVFPSLVLGRIWKRMFKIPFVVDLQDPWRNDYYLQFQKKQRPPKFLIAHKLDSYLEKFTMPSCDGIIAVSAKYPKDINERYGIKIPSIILPFSASKSDYKIVESLRIENPIFKKGKGIYISYVGVVPPPMLPTVRLLLKVISEIESEYKLKIFVNFIGTSYDINAKEQSEISQYATELQLCNFNETTRRVSHFESLRIVQDSDVMLVPGTLDEGYTASKIYSYILSQKPIIALIHEKSSISNILKKCNTGPVITFRDEYDLNSKEAKVKEEILKVLEKIPFKPDINWANYKAYSVEEMVIKQLSFLKKTLKHSYEKLLP